MNNMCKVEKLYNGQYFLCQTKSIIIQFDMSFQFSTKQDPILPDTCSTKCSL